MASPALPDYAATPFNPTERPGIIAALKMGIDVTLPPTADGMVPYTQRDLNEMVSRGWVTRFRQRAFDKAWSWTLTPAGTEVALALTWVKDDI